MGVNSFTLVGTGEPAHFAVKTGLVLGAWMDNSLTTYLLG